MRFKEILDELKYQILHTAADYKGDCFWKEDAVASMDAKPTLVNIENDSRVGKYVSNKKTTVVFSDGFCFVSNKTKYNGINGNVNFYEYYVDDELKEEIIADAVKAHECEAPNKIQKEKRLLQKDERKVQRIKKRIDRKYKV